MAKSAPAVLLVITAISSGDNDEPISESAVVEVSFEADQLIYDTSGINSIAEWAMKILQLALLEVETEVAKRLGPPGERKSDAEISARNETETK